jgi:hypothetical protein
MSRISRWMIRIVVMIIFVITLRKIGRVLTVRLG